MNKKQITPLEALNNIKKSLKDKDGFLHLHDNCNVIVVENALKEYEEAKAHIETLNREHDKMSAELRKFEALKEIFVLEIVFHGDNTIYFHIKEKNTNNEYWYCLNKEQVDKLLGDKL